MVRISVSGATEGVGRLATGVAVAPPGGGHQGCGPLRSGHRPRDEVFEGADDAIEVAEHDAFGRPEWPLELPQVAYTSTVTEAASVIVPARNEEQFIGRCLDSVLAQTERNLQVIVVDGDSDDRTAEVVRAYRSRDPRVELLHNPRRIIPVSLNLALSTARAPWVVRIDAHSTVPPGYVADTLNRMREGRWGGVGGRKDGVGITRAGRAIAAAMATPFGVGNSTYHYGTEPRAVDHIPFGAYPTALARELGGWDEEFVVNQDFEFDWRVREAGHQLLFDPRLRIEWHCRQSIGDLFRQYRRYGQGKVQVAHRHPRSLRARHLAAPALVAWLAAGAVAGVRRPLYALGAALPYLAGVAVASLRTAPRVDRGSRRYLPAAFGAMHLGWGVGFWIGFARLLRRRP